MAVFTAKVITDWDPQKPLTTTKLNQLYDNTQYNKDLIGSHLHTGTDGSALIQVGPNFLRNGSFESGFSGWTPTPSATGTIAVNNVAANVYDGAYSAAITSTVLADGGGTLPSNEFIPVTGGQGYAIFGAAVGSVAGVSGKVEVEWYDITQALISSTPAYNSASVPTSFTLFNTFVPAPANARYMRIICTGGIPATGTAVGTVYFDGLFLTELPQLPSGTTGVTQAIGNNSQLLATTAYADTHVQKDAGNLGVGVCCIMKNNAGATLAAGGTVAGASADTSYFNVATLTAGVASVGTWRNICGLGIPAGSAGMFQRIA